MSTYGGVPLPDNWSEWSVAERTSWMSGVDAACRVGRPDPAGVLKLTGWAKQSVLAFGHIVSEDIERARETVESMSPKQRLVLSHEAEELSRLMAEVRGRRDRQDVSRKL